MVHQQCSIMIPDIKHMACCFSRQSSLRNFRFMIHVHSFAENFSDNAVKMCCVEVFTVIKGNYVALTQAVFLLVITVKLVKCCFQLTFLFWKESNAKKNDLVTIKPSQVLYSVYLQLLEKRSIFVWTLILPSDFRKPFAKVLHNIPVVYLWFWKENVFVFFQS